MEFPKFLLHSISIDLLSKYSNLFYWVSNVFSVHGRHTRPEGGLYYNAFYSPLSNSDHKGTHLQCIWCHRKSDSRYCGFPVANIPAYLASPYHTSLGYTVPSITRPGKFCIPYVRCTDLIAQRQILTPVDDGLAIEADCW